MQRNEDRECSNKDNLIADDQETQDISRLPALTFEDVVKYSKDRSGCSNTAKACKFMAEPGYLHDIKGT